MKIPIKNQMIVLLQNKNGITQMTNSLVFGGMEQQRRYDEIKLNFKLNYDFNTINMFNNNDINCFMTKNKIYNKVKLHIEVKSFGSFPSSNDIIKNLPFAIDNIKSPIININKKTTLNQNLDNFDMLRFNYSMFSIMDEISIINNLISQLTMFSW